MSTIRFDAARFSKTKTTQDGYLETEATVTRTGVFKYMNADGTIRNELRHPDDVFKKESLDSMKMIPITDGHPEQRLVNSKTAKELQSGYVGESIHVDGKYIKAPLVVTDETAIGKIKNGKNQLSLGYTADVISESGIYDGKHYDSRQTNIKYNHLAICNVARAGAEASIKLDSGEAMQIDDLDDTNNKNYDKKNRSDNAMPKIVLDGIDYEASAEVINAYNKSLARVDELEKAVDKKQGVLDALEADNKTLKEKVETFDKTFNDVVNDAVKARVILIASAKKILADKVKLDEMSNIDIKKAVITNISKDAKLDDVSEDYINARFDAALEMQDMRKDMSSQRKTVNDDKSSAGGNKSKLEVAKAKYQQRLVGGKQE